MVEQGAVVGELAVAVRDGGPQRGFTFLGGGIWLRDAGETVASVVEVVVVEELAEPSIETRDVPPPP